MPVPSVFSLIPPTEYVASNDLAYAIRDQYPVSPGHTLIIPKREISTWWDASESERQAILQLVDVVRANLITESQPDGFNVGFNAGEAAGQTVFHFHCHVIPRYVGDMQNPRGGVRHCVEGKGDYKVE